MDGLQIGPEAQKTLGIGSGFSGVTSGMNKDDRTQVNAYIKQQQNLSDQVAGVEAQRSAAAKENTALSKAAMSAELAHANAPLDLPKMPEAPVFKPAEMSQQFSLLLGLAALTGAASRQPLTAALNNMTGALEGLHEGNKEKFDQHWKEYEANWKKADAETKRLIDAYDKKGKALHLSVEDQDKIGHLVDTEFGNEISRKLREEGRLGDVYKYIETVKQHREKAEEFHQRMAETKAAHEQAHKDKVAAMGGVGSGDITEADRANAWNMILNGKSISGMYGMGDKAGRGRAQRAYDEILKEHNISPFDAAMISTANASTKVALNDITKRDANIRTIQDKLIGHASKLLELVEKGGGDTQFVTVNNAEVWAKQHLNDKDAIEFVNQMNLFGNEFARLSSPASNAMLPEGARDESREALNKGYTKESISGLIDLIKYDAEISHKAFTDERKRLLGSMFEAGSQAPAASAHQPYSDPDKEARYQKWKAEHANQ